MAMADESYVVLLGDRRYAVHRRWARLPAGESFGFISDLMVDRRGRVHVAQRGTDRPVLVFDQGGRLEGTWGEGQLAEPHYISLAPDGSILVADRDAHQILRFDDNGRLLQTLGNRHWPSLAAPFNHPTAAAQALLRNRIVELFLRANDPKAAQTQLDALVRDEPTNPLTHYFIGIIAAEQKDWDKAVESFERAIQLNEGAKREVDQFYYELAEIHLRRDDAEAALKLLAKARGKFKSTFLLEYLTGMAHSRLKDYAASIKHFTSAELLAKRDEPERLTALFFFQVGTAFERHKDFKQAETYFRQSLQLAPDFAEVLNYLGYMWAERGENLTEAKEMIGKALKQEPENAAFLDSMAWVLFRLKQPKEALEFQLQALKHQKEPDATLHDHLGDIYLALKEPQKARDQWEKALSIEPSDEISKKLKATPAKP